MQSFYTSKSSSELYPIVSLLLEQTKKDLSKQLVNLDNYPSEQEIVNVVQQNAVRFGIEISNRECDEIVVQINKEQKTFGILQELIDDPTISDIIVSDYKTISVQKNRQNQQVPISFINQEHYETYIERLLNKANVSYSTKIPFVDGIIGGNVRIHAVHKSRCDTQGPYLTLRINRFSSVNENDLIQSGLAPKAVFDYLRGVINCGCTILVAGEVGTGKTTLARALSSAIPKDESILIIEDTPEIYLEHPHCRRITTREDNFEGEGKVSPSGCIKAGMRMAMNRIIFGEIRDGEAAESFIDACTSGHSGVSTIHARTTTEAIKRLELFLGRAQAGVNHNFISEQVGLAVQIVIHIQVCKVTQRRRISEIKELGAVTDGVIRQRPIFLYECKGNQPKWLVQNRLSAYKEKIENYMNLSLLPQELAI